MAPGGPSVFWKKFVILRFRLADVGLDANPLDGVDVFLPNGPAIVDRCSQVGQEVEGRESDEKGTSDADQKIGLPAENCWQCIYRKVSSLCMVWLREKEWRRVAEGAGSASRSHVSNFTAIGSLLIYISLLFLVIIVG